MTLKPDIILHGIGNVGKRVARFADKKGWRIVAAYNRAGDKIGQDVGQLADLGRDLGVKVQDVLNLAPARGSADIAIIATTGGDFLDAVYDDSVKYLEAGINVICHGTQAHNPFFDNAVVAAKIDRIAKANNVTFSGTTIWDATRVWPGILACSNCLEINSVALTVTSELGKQGAQFEAAIGCGMSAEDFAEKFGQSTHPLETHLHGPAAMVLQNLGCKIVKVHKLFEPIILQNPRFSPHTRITYPQGVVGGVRVVADLETEEGITGCVNAEYRLFEDGEEEVTVWNVRGLPDMEISIRRGDAANLSPAAIINRIPDVIAARAGIVEIFRQEMGPMTTSALV